jgi:hypothetical protein
MLGDVSVARSGHSLHTAILVYQSKKSAVTIVERYAIALGFYYCPQGYEKTTDLIL